MSQSRSLLIIITSIMVALLLLLNDLKAAETRIKVAVIDSGISQEQANSKYICENGVKSFIPNDSGIDQHGHGTNIIGLITESMDHTTHCIVSYKVWAPHFGGSDTLEYSNLSLFDISTDPMIKFLNVSMSGPSDDDKERALYQAIVNNGIEVSVAAGNDGRNLDKRCNIYPACYGKAFNSPRFNVIGSSTGDFGNTGNVVTAYVDGVNKGLPTCRGSQCSGTSQSTAIYTGNIISKK